MIPSRRLVHQRGASPLTLLVTAIIVGFLLLMAMRVFPSVNEYLTIRKAVTQIMHSNPGSAADIRKAFERTTEVEYSIKTIGPKDLEIEPIGDTGALRTSFAYNVEIPIFDPVVFILVKYSGSANSGGSKGP
ncbi:MAG: DUF4845 domain-containing protein [Burkholderiales bacterium]|jgi:hypothetical protein|nr:DUF4845 domain-containing protein [Burkholderiales bacterium]